MVEVSDWVKVYSDDMDVFTRLDHPYLLTLWRYAGAGWPVLYIHGATFPIALSVAHRFDGFSWADSLHAAGLDVWGLDFAGYGASRGADVPQIPAVEQIDAAVAAIQTATGYDSVTIIAHSWGSIPAGMFAVLNPRSVKALILFGPIAQRGGPPAGAPDQGWRLITADDQYRRFVEDVPSGESPVLSPAHFSAWAPMWLATDPASQDRCPHSVRVPRGPYNDIAAAWSGRLPYDPARLACPTLIVRGIWDRVCDDDDVAWFRDRVSGRLFHHVEVARGTHLLHLEAQRFELYAACEQFIRQQLRMST